MEERPTVFIAHSTHDLQDARLVRNIFEAREHDVLLLKLSQQMTDHFLENLLRKEIQARDWLVVVASENSQRSSWVKFEQSYAKERRKPIFYIEIERCRRLQGAQREKCLHEQVARISRAIRVFLSYSRQDRDTARRLAEDLRRHGYEVWLDIDKLSGGQDWAQAIERGIDWALEKGAVIILLSADSVRSEWVRSELRYALTKQGRVIPCLIGPWLARMPLELDSTLGHIQSVNLSDSYERGFRQLLAALG